jgi:hypothetical protein
MFEWENDWSPGWRFAGTHFHWTSRLENIGREYLKRLFGVPQDAEVPPVSNLPTTLINSCFDIFA